MSAWARKPWNGGTGCPRGHKLSPERHCRLRSGQRLAGTLPGWRRRLSWPVYPLPEESERLELTAGTPAVEIVRTAYDQDGTPIEVNEMIADGGAYVFRYEFDA